MKRKLTVREWMLLGVLAIMVIVAGYILLFYNPTTAARDAALAEAESCKEQTAAAQVRLEEKRRMERELDEIFARNPNPLGLADYDNLQPVMVELNTILKDTQNYSLNFATVSTADRLVRRQISVSFTCDSYREARDVLQALHDSSYRCMLNNVSITLGNTYNSSTSVNGTIVFFEFQTQ